MKDEKNIKRIHIARSFKEELSNVKLRETVPLIKDANKNTFRNSTVR